jgi:DNA-binding response OmpR family regulator
MLNAPSSTNAKILIVEDDVAISSALQTLLHHYEFNTTVARTLTEGRNQLASLPNLIILDLVLPDGDGIDLLERIRRINCQVPVIVLTGSADPEHHRRIIRLKPARRFQKPLNFFELLDAIRHELELKGVPDPAAQPTLI